MIGYLVSSLDNAVIFEQTIRIGQAIGDRSLETRTYVLQAYEAQNTMRYSDCLALFDKIDRFDAEFGSSDCEGFVSRIKGAFALYQGDPEAAIGHFRSAANWFSEKGELFYQARVRLELALAAIDLGDADLAAANLVGLMERANGIRYIIIIPTIRSCMGHVELLRGNFEAAISAFHQSLEAFKELSGLFFEGEQWNAVGRTYLAMGRKSDARASFGKAAELWLLDGLPVAASVAVFGLAAVCIQEEDFGRAGRLYSVADREIRSAGASLNRFHENFRELVRKEILSRHGDKELALETLTLAEAVSLGSMPSSVRF